MKEVIESCHACSQLHKDTGLSAGQLVIDNYGVFSRKCLVNLFGVLSELLWQFHLSHGARHSYKDMTSCVFYHRKAVYSHQAAKKLEPGHLHVGVHCRYSPLDKKVLEGLLFFSTISGRNCVIRNVRHQT